MVSIQIDPPLPVLRSDIEIFSGPLEEDGSPMYIIHDPVSGSYSKIGWEEAMVLQRLRRGQTLSSLIRELNAQTTLRIDPEEVSALCADAQTHRLTMAALIQPPDQLMQMAATQKVTPLTWLIRHYLYFRVPLVHPDKFLEKHISSARKLISPPAKLMYLFFACMGIYFLSQRFETFVSTFSYFFSFRGAVAYAAVIVALKTTHEFAHAFVAKHYGLRVPTMGMAFMVFFPVAYSDVTDAWRLRSRRKRLHIALAGVKAELVIGAFALACWGMTPPGIINSICFLLSSTTLISTLFINLNPAMRFDGYYIISDWWGIDNLWDQTTRFTKWYLRRLLLGLKAPIPVKGASTRRQFQMVLYALYAWHYRLFLYLGIAVLVYHKFTKVLGITLFMVEISFFILRPVIEEINMLRKERHRIKFNIRLGLTISAFLLVIAWAVLPLPRTENAPAVYLPERSQTIYAPMGGEIVDILKHRGDMVDPGDGLLIVKSEPLMNEIRSLNVTLAMLRRRIDTLSGDADRMALVPEIEKQLASGEERLAGLMEQKNKLLIRATIGGIISDLDQTLSASTYVRENQVLGRVVSVNEARINAFVSEKEIAYIRTGNEVAFYPADRSQKIIGVVERINPIREEYVDAMDIGSVAAEDLPLVKDPSSGGLAFVESFYKVVIKPKPPYPQTTKLGASGRLRYHTPNRSLVLEFIQYCYSILIRESGF